jgi:hypothetical protein
MQDILAVIRSNYLKSIKFINCFSQQSKSKLNDKTKLTKCLIHASRHSCVCFVFLFYQLQGSQTCGPREGPMRPANIRKNEDFEGNIKSFCLFYQIIWFLTHNSKILFPCGPRDLTLSLMRPASQFEFETPDLLYAKSVCLKKEGERVRVCLS